MRNECRQWTTKKQNHKHKTSSTLPHSARRLPTFMFCFLVVHCLHSFRIYFFSHFQSYHYVSSGSLLLLLLSHLWQYYCLPVALWFICSLCYCFQVSFYQSAPFLGGFFLLRQKVNHSLFCKQYNCRMKMNLLICFQKPCKKIVG